MTVFKRLCRKLLRLNRDIEYTKKCFSASHHPECKGRHKIIIKMKILSKCFLVFEVHIVGYVFIKAIYSFLEAEWDVTFHTSN